MSIYNNKIIVVDDDPGIRDSFGTIFSNRSQLDDILEKGADIFSSTKAPPASSHSSLSFDLTFAESGEQGVETVKSAFEKKLRFAVAFVDMKMTGIDGAETVRQIWAIDPLIKVVIVTAYSEYSLDDIIQKTQKEELFYLRKPFISHEILQFARTLTKQWNLEQEKKTLADKLEKSREKELNTASRIQNSLLIGTPPINTKKINIAHLTIPSQKVDGDFYDFFSLSEDAVDLVVGDVMGKGVPAALLGAATKNHFLRALYQLLADNSCAQIPEPEEIVSVVKSNTIETLEDLDTFVTLCYARFDIGKNKLSLVDCGHMRTIHYHFSSENCSYIEGYNMPIGFPEMDPIKQVSLPFEPGDLFFFYSDGLTEAANANGDFFGEERLIEAVSNNIAKDPETVITHIHREILAFTGEELFTDDFTIVAVKIDE